MKRYLLTVTLEDMPYDCWRKIIVPSELPLDALHLILQRVMGWRNAHMYQFQFAKKRYSPASEYDDDSDCEGVTETTLGEALGRKTSFTYEYDLGDSWMHTIHVQNVKDDFEPGKIFYCVDGKGNCPPEDCGGTWGFQEMLETLSDPEHEEFAEMREWADMEDEEDVASRWPGKFPLAAINKWLAKLKQP
jgi:hypothetical protein